MSVALQIKDENASGELISATIIQFPAEKITVRELIEGRVADEVEKFNASRKGRFIGLIQPSASEIELYGFRMKKGKTVDVEEQKAVAISAFESNGFFLLVNDKQVTELGDVLTITPNTSVTFIKLTPLVGG